jgi:hypothetical protein
VRVLLGPGSNRCQYSWHMCASTQSNALAQLQILYTACCLLVTHMAGKTAQAALAGHQASWTPVRPLSHTLRILTWPGWKTSKAPSMYTIVASGGATRPLENCTRRREVGRKRDSVVRDCSLLCCSMLNWRARG